MIHALHGFLGSPSDWNFFQKSFQIQAIDLFQFGPPSHELNLHKWAQQFNHSVHNESPRILMGYSLGGRLALHSLLHNQQQWDAAIIVSAHPGLQLNQDRSKRIEEDKQWAQRFLQDPWDNVISDWNQQSVFSEMTPSFHRKEEESSRNILSSIFLHWSLGLQDNLRHQIALLPMPILWITGQKDKKYTIMAQELQFLHPASKAIVIPSCGHRVPWEQPMFFENHVLKFVEEVKILDKNAI